MTFVLVLLPAASDGKKMEINVLSVMLFQKQTSFSKVDDLVVRVIHCYMVVILVSGSGNALCFLTKEEINIHFFSVLHQFTQL